MTKKVVVHFKTPDCLHLELADNEDDLAEIKKKLEKWIEYGENIRVEFDLDDLTARVLEI